MRLARLDGIRGLAIVLVFAHHVVNFTPGWVGVDIFFVLSGYFITSLLRQDRDKPSYWSAFYIRRATRILPPLVICFSLAALLIRFPWKRLGGFYIFFGANLAEALSPLRGDRELTVLWSLAVEEQFYLIWPFAVRYLSRKNLLRLIAILLLLEPVLRAVATPYVGWWQMYILTPFRLDGLLIGSLISVLVEDERWCTRLSRISAKGTLIGLGTFASLSIAPSFSYKETSILFSMIGYSLLDITAGMMLSYVLLVDTCFLSRALTSRWLVFVGILSYGIYLYHELVVRAVQLLVVRIGYNHMRTVSPFTALLTIVLAWLSYRFYEAPLIAFGRSRANGTNRLCPTSQRTVALDSSSSKTVSPLHSSTGSKAHRRETL